LQPAVILRTEENKDAAIRRIKAIKPDIEKPLAVWIGPYKKIRSLEQNALYWRLVGRISDATGHDRETLHTFFKRRAFGTRVEQIGAEMVEVIPSSAAAGKGDFSELIEHVQAFISEHGFEEQI
jgi:dihydroorotate dehydrogenase